MIAVLTLFYAPAPMNLGSIVTDAKESVCQVDNALCCSLKGAKVLLVAHFWERFKLQDILNSTYSYGFEE